MDNKARRILRIKRRGLPRTFEYDDYPRGASDFLKFADHVKSRFPHFCATIFVIPTEMDGYWWKQLRRRRRWIRVGAHGVYHLRGEWRYPEFYLAPDYMRTLDEIAKDVRYTKLIKGPWHGASSGFMRLAKDRGLSVCLKSINDAMPFPTESFSSWNLADAQFAEFRATTYGEKGRFIEAHPIYRREDLKKTKSQKTELSAFNAMRWTQFWHPDDRWEFVDELKRPTLTKINLGCGASSTFVWDDWLCLDPARQWGGSVDKRVIDWSFDHQIPVSTCQADIVMTGHVFNYIAEEDYAAALLECWRVLRPGGVLRMQEDETTKYTWRRPGQGSRRTGPIKSLPTKEKILKALRRVGFTVYDARLGYTRSPHKDCLKGDSRTRRAARGHKYVLECVKEIDAGRMRAMRKWDPRATRRHRFKLPPE